MRERLLHHSDLFRKLRQLLVLFTLLLVPSMTWGQTITVAGHGPDDEGNITGTNITSGTVKYDAESSTLTLDNARVNGTVSTSLTELNVHLKGHSVFNVETNTSNNTYLFNGTGASLTLNYSAESIGDVLEGIGTADSYKLKVSNNLTTENYDGTAEIWKNSNSLENGKDYCKLTKPYLYVGDIEIDKSNYNSFEDYFSFDAASLSLTISGIANTAIAYDWLVKSFLANLTVNISDNIIYQLKTGTSTGKVFVYTGTDNTRTLTLNIAEGKTLKTCWSTGTGDAGWINEGFTNTNISTDLSTMGSSGAYAEATQLSEEYSILFSKVELYDLSVAGTRVTSLNSANILNDANSSVSFTPASTGNNNVNTLTLNGASIDGTITSGLSNLTIAFQGTNSLTGTSGYITSTNNAAPLTLKGGTGTSTLSLDNTVGITAISGFVSLTYDGAYLTASRGCRYVTGTNPGIKDIKGGIVQPITITTEEYFPLWVYSQQVSSTNYGNVLGNGKVSYNATDHKLTLENADISSSNVIESELSDHLIIALKGNNSLEVNTGNNSPIMSGYDTATLTFQKVGTSDCRLDIGFYGVILSSPIITGFESVSYTGLNFASKTGATLNGATTYDAVLTSATIYPLWIGGTLVTEANHSFDGTSGTIDYASGTNTLTLTNYQNTFATGHAIETGIEGLKVKLIGASEITCSDNDGYAFYTQQPTTASIQFVREDESSMLTMTTETDDYYNGFGDGKVTYDGHLFHYTDDGGKYIAQPAAPVLDKSIGYDENDIPYTFVSIDYADTDKSGGTVKYLTAEPTLKFSFDYVDSKLTDITNEDYPEDGIKMTAPGILTAWVEVAGAKSAETKGVRFGILENPIEMEFKGESKQINFTPAPTMTNPVTVSITDAISFATHDATNNKLTINNCFDGRVSVSFANTDEGYTKLNMDSTLVTFNIKPIAPTLSLESGVYYVNQQLTVTPGITGTDYETTLNINDGVQDYPYTFSAVNQYGYGVRAITKYTPSNIASDYAEAKYYICNTPAFTGQYADQSSYTGNQNGNVYVVITSSYLPDGCKLMYYTGSDQSKAVAFTEAIQLNETTTINAFIRYTSNEGPTVTYDSEPVSQTFTVNQTLDIPPFGAGINYQTCFLPNYSLTKPEGLKVYTITNVSDNSVVVSEIEEYIPKGVAVLLEKVGDEPANGYSAQTYSGTIGDFSSNKLKYAYEIVETTGDQYVLYNNEFVKATGDIPQTKCYLDLSGAAHSRGMYSIGDGTTAIKGIEPDTTGNDHDVWFDLQGRRIAKPTKAGLYIVNGKKVVINNK